MDKKDYNLLIRKESENQTSEKERLIVNVVEESRIETTNFFTSEKEKKSIEKKIEKRIQKSIQKQRVFIFSSFFKYAAVAVIMLATSITLYYNKHVVFNNTENKKIVTNNNITSGSDKAVLTLSDGTNVFLEKGSTYQSKNSKSNGKTIVYYAKHKNKSKKIENLLTVPRGGQFQITLSDGTKVWLNSESQLKYPVNFIDGETRQVELVYGEAYFDVTPSNVNSGSKFIVLNKSQKIEVLGTEFNVKAYKDETHVYTTLVQGKVKVDYTKNQKYLQPNEQLNLNVLNQKGSVLKVDVKNVIAWKNGIFSFKGESLKSIMKTLSRWYDVDVEFSNKKLEDLKFKGVINKSQNMNEILKIMTSTTINSYEITNRKIILN